MGEMDVFDCSCNITARVRIQLHVGMNQVIDQENCISGCSNMYILSIKPVSEYMY